MQAGFYCQMYAPIGHRGIKLGKRAFLRQRKKYNVTGEMSFDSLYFLGVRPVMYIPETVDVECKRLLLEV